MRSIILSLLVAALPCTAVAQTVTPMQGDVVTFGDKAALKLHISNPYPDARRFSVNVLSMNWEPVQGALVSRRFVQIAPGASQQLFVQAPVSETGDTEFYVCAMTESVAAAGAGLRGRVCGKYRAIRREL